jgi:hypothetical protein
MTEENTVVEPEETTEEAPKRRGNPNFFKRQEGGQKDTTETLNAKAVNRPDRSKPRRVKFSERNRISFDNKDPDYVYRVVNDKDGRITKMQGIGYEFVESDEQLGDYRVAEGSKMGKAVSKPVGNGVNGYLMRIRKEFYEEDKAEKEKRVDATEAALKPSKAKEEYGPGLTND